MLDFVPCLIILISLIVKQIVGGFIEFNIRGLHLRDNEWWSIACINDNSGSPTFIYIAAYDFEESQLLLGQTYIDGAIYVPYAQLRDFSTINATSYAVQLTPTPNGEEEQYRLALKLNGTSFAVSDLMENGWEKSIDSNLTVANISRVYVLASYATSCTPYLECYRLPEEPDEEEMRKKPINWYSK